MGWGIALVGLAIAIIAYLMVDYFLPGHSPAVAKLDNYRREWKRLYGWTYLDKPIVWPAVPPVVRLGRVIVRRLGVHDALEAKLSPAGVTAEPEYFVARHLLLCTAAGFITYFVGGFFGAALVVAIGGAVPFPVLRLMARRRRAQIEAQLAETLQLIAGLLRAGHGFPQALSAVAKETPPPISLALQKLFSEMNLGQSLEEGLDKLAAEVDSVALNWTVTAVKIQREIGGNLAEILETLARSIRERDQLGRQIKALTAEGRISALILLVLPVVLAFLLYSTNRAYMSLLWTTSAGRLMIGATIFLMVLGVIWMRKIVKVDV